MSTHDCGKGDMCPEFGLRAKAYEMSDAELAAAIATAHARSVALASAATDITVVLDPGSDGEEDLRYAKTIVTRALDASLTNLVTFREVRLDRDTRTNGTVE